MSYERRLKLAAAAWALVAVLTIVTGAAMLVSAFLSCLEADTSWPLEAVLAAVLLVTGRLAIRRAWVAIWTLRTEPWRRRLRDAARKLDGLP
jgi:hypothetical protein